VLHVSTVFTGHGRSVKLAHQIDHACVWLLKCMTVNIGVCQSRGHWLIVRLTATCVLLANEGTISVPQRYGRCEPTGARTADCTIATVVKAHDGDGLWATAAGSDRVLKTSTQSCAVLRRTLIEELFPASGGSGGASLPHVALSHIGLLDCI
jgi:hypothetical protein